MNSAKLWIAKTAKYLLTNQGRMYMGCQKQEANKNGHSTVSKTGIASQRIKHLLTSFHSVADKPPIPYAVLQGPFVHIQYVPRK